MCSIRLKYEGNPVLKPETALEKGSEYNSWYANGPYLPAAVSKDGGVWWDPQDKVFKLWYEAGWLENIAYAISTDGIHWKRPSLDLQVGTNRILPDLILILILSFRSFCQNQTSGLKCSYVEMEFLYI